MVPGILLGWSARTITCVSIIIRGCAIDRLYARRALAMQVHPHVSLEVQYSALALLTGPRTSLNGRYYNDGADV